VCKLLIIFTAIFFWHYRHRGVHRGLGFKPCWWQFPRTKT